MKKKKIKFKLSLNKKRYNLLGLLIIIIFSLIFFYITILKDLPSPYRLNTASLPLSTKIYDRHGKLLYTIYNQKNQSFTSLTDIPKYLIKATLVAEDKDFYKHGAVDIKGIARALYATIFKKQLQGGSTLTQQLVKNSLLTPERTLKRKIKEIILSFATEMIYTKDQILEMYLNQVPYGGTAYGVEAASQTYFGKRVTELTLAESAFLAGLPEAPSTYSPYGTRPELGKKRQEYILRRMYEQNFITKKQFEDAKKEKFKIKNLANTIRAPHFVLYVKELLVQKYGEKTVEQGGLSVYTSLDLTIQDFAQQTVASEVAKLKNLNVTNGAALITKPGTGEILAMVGSKNYFDQEIDGNVNITLAKLQPGSAIKPINYAVGLMKGYTASTVFIDQPMCFPANPPYCPKNYDGKFRGPVQLRFALGNSLNIPAVQMLKLNGLDAMIATASAMGISTFKDPSKYGLSLTLGGGEVTMLDMATAFAVFANRGYRVDLHPILKVIDRTGRVLEEYKPLKSPIFGKKVLPQGVAFIISHILLDNNARSQAFGTNSALRIDDLPVSVKTGTTNDYKDNWTIGYTPSILVATWVGNNDHSPMRGIVSGVTGAAPIWNKIMSHLLDPTKPEWPKQPPDVVARAVCITTGLLAPKEGTPDRCQIRMEYFLKDSLPKGNQPEKKKILIDKATNDLAKPGQVDNVEEREEMILTDNLGNMYCLSCPHPTPTPNN